MFFFKFVLLLASVSVVICGRRNEPSLGLIVPDPLIEVFSPRGLKVSIPDAPGIQLFAFHANINKPMNGIEAGEISRDIIKKEKGRWVFRDANIQIQVGDTIYFWFYVLKDGLGYKFDNGEFKIEEITRGPFPDVPVSHHSHHCDSQVEPEKVPAGVQQYSQYCEKTLVNLTRALINLHLEMDSLRETNSILKDLIEKHQDASRWLKLSGKFPPDDNPIKTTQDFMRLKLDLSISVVNATKCSDNTCIRFEVERLEDKINVVKATKSKLSSSKFTITY